MLLIILQVQVIIILLCASSLKVRKATAFERVYSVDRVASISSIFIAAPNRKGARGNVTRESGRKLSLTMDSLLLCSLAE
jgi:hypothetical protein